MVEQATTKLGNTFKWLPNNSFERYSVVKPCILEHPQTGKKVWYVLSLTIFLFLLQKAILMLNQGSTISISAILQAGKLQKSFLHHMLRIYVVCFVCLFFLRNQKLWKWRRNESRRPSIHYHPNIQKQCESKMACW